MVTAISKEFVWDVLHTVLDPEVPVLSVVDLGIVRDVRLEQNVWIVDICPTYSGCPALDVIANDIRAALSENDILPSKVNYVLDKAWTTDWITEEGAQKLKKYGIAPPKVHEFESIACPQCDSENTKLISYFGSTACKSLYKCNDCLEPFEYFKCK